jgi:predicted GTPase
VKPFYLSNRSTFQIQLVPLHQGTKRAIVYDQPGITRDRMYIRSFW